MNLIKKTMLGAGLAATALVTATPAMANDYRHHDNGAGTAIVAGIAGLAIGAIIAGSSHNDRYDDRYYDQGYYPAYSGYYTNGGWYDGYRYNNCYFYDRDGYRRYDRNTWARRGHDNHRDYRGYSYERRGY
jgi:hypothetical protein